MIRQKAPLPGSCCGDCLRVPDAEEWTAECGIAAEPTHDRDSHHAFMSGIAGGDEALVLPPMGTPPVERAENIQDAHERGTPM